MFEDWSLMLGILCGCLMVGICWWWWWVFDGGYLLLVVVVVVSWWLWL